MLCDTKGPEVRTGNFDPPKVELKTGQDYIFTTEECIGDTNRCSITYKGLPKDVEVGTRIWWTTA